MAEGLLDYIISPYDVKNLPSEMLEELAAAVRKRIIEVMSVNGGHLASNLGAVELTLALHRVFNSPEDKFIWDVSHQTYTHKLLTGRNKDFGTIRQYKGLCGFSHPKESEHDHFYAGHAGTALSLALGCAKTRDLNNKQDYIIPIIGDATLTCGMSLEALNNVSRDTKRFIIILNDNEMSISKNVGAITRILSRMVANPTTDKLYHELSDLLSRIPNYGPRLAHHGLKITESIKNLFSPAAFFEQYGVSYMGPIDGHDVHKLIETFEQIKECNWPVVLHVMTNKGQGMESAILNPCTYHGVKPFDLDTGKFHPTPSAKPTFPKIFGDQVLHMAREDESVVVVTPAMSAGSCLDAMMEEFPDRCLDVGIAEAHSITFAGGLAYQGTKKVFASIYATFLQRAFDNLFHDVCLQELPVVFAIDRAGISGPDGSTHHGIYDISFLNAMPNMIIAQPRNGRILRELLLSAHDWNRPVAIRYPNAPTEDTTESLSKRYVGKGEVLEEGDDVLIIGLGVMTDVALQVRKILREQNIEACVLDPIFIKPLDSELLTELVAKHSRVVTLEEHSATSGMGSILSHFFFSQGFSNLQVLNLGIPETYLNHGSNKELLDAIGLTPDKIAARILHYFDFNSTPSIEEEMAEKR
jgi:1-deoxy-D-xylulose-5-phosphate synthase